MVLSHRQIEVLRAAAGAPGQIPRRDDWHGMTLRSLVRAGYIELGTVWITVTWWGAHDQKVQEDQPSCRQLVRITPLGRECVVLLDDW